MEWTERERDVIREALLKFAGPGPHKYNEDGYHDAGLEISMTRRSIAYDLWLRLAKVTA